MGNWSEPEFVASRRDETGNVTERMRHLTVLGDRFLAEARVLGFTAQEAVRSLCLRLHEGKDNHASLSDQES